MDTTESGRPTSKNGCVDSCWYTKLLVDACLCPTSLATEHHQVNVTLIHPPLLDAQGGARLLEALLDCGGGDLCLWLSRRQRIRPGIELLT